MNLSACSRFFLVVLNSLLLVSCAAPQNADESTALAVDADRQYMCVSKIYLSDMTKAFSLPAAGSNKTGDIQAGKILDKAVQNIFWTDSSSAMSGRALPVVSLGFDGATGVDTNSSKYYAQISLQFQIFKPTGQSYMDVVVGQSSGPASGQAASEATINAAIMQALHRLGGTLVNAQICRAM